MKSVPAYIESDESDCSFLSNFTEYNEESSLSIMSLPDRRNHLPLNSNNTKQYPNMQINKKDI